MRTIVQGIAVEYRDEGHGPLILLLHGWLSSLGSFDEIAMVLARRHRVVRLDFPGFGQSEMPRGAWDVGQYAAFTAAFIEKLEIQPALIVGHSFGGRVILKGCSSGVLRVPKIALIASAGVARRNSLRLRAYRMIAKIGKTLGFFLPSLSVWMRERLYMHAGSDHHLSPALQGVFRAVVREDLSAAAVQITEPTLLLWGEDDATTPLEDGRKLYALIPNARLVTYPGAGHNLHQERAAEVARELEILV